MMLARTIDGYKPTKDIVRGDILLNNGTWFVAETNSVETPVYKYTFDNGIYTYSKKKDITPKECNIPLPFTESDKCNFLKGYNVQRPFKFPLRITENLLARSFIKLNKEIPIITDRGFIIDNADLTYDYNNNTLNDMVNGILYKNINTPQHHNTRIVYYKPLNDTSIFILHLASIHSTNNEMLFSTYQNLMKIVYSFNPTERMMIQSMKMKTDDYTNEYKLVNVECDVGYTLPNQDFDINNFSSI